MRRLIFFGGAGAVNSLRKQRDEKSQITALALTNRGFDNLQKSFIAFVVHCGVRFYSPTVAAIFWTPGFIAYLFTLAIILTGEGTVFYGCFKMGEGMVDLLQSRTKLDDFSPPKSLSK